MEIDGKPIASGRAYQQAREFGSIEKDRILNLMILKSRCLRQDDALRMELEFQGMAMSFFGAIVGAVDCLMFSLINDEANDCLEDRGPVKDLLASIVHDAAASEFGPGQIQAAVDDMAALFRERTNFVVGSAYLDFVVSTFSAFEMFMSKVYEPLRARTPRSDGRLTRLEKMIAEYNAASDEKKKSVLSRMSKEVPSDYVSGREKIEFVLSKQPKDWDRSKSLNTVAFYANSRNSIHSLGRSKGGKDFRYDAGGLDLIHGAGAGLSTNDRSDIVRLCGELVDIYRDVVAANIDLSSDVFLAVEDGAF